MEQLHVELAFLLTLRREKKRLNAVFCKWNMLTAYRQLLNELVNTPSSSILFPLSATQHDRLVCIAQAIFIE